MNFSSIKDIDLYRPIAIALVLIAAFGLWFAIFHKLEVEQTYQMHSHYSRMPADDIQLEKWLRTQPNVVATTVHIERTSNGIQANFWLMQTLSHENALPDLPNACEHLGYEPFSNWIIQDLCTTSGGHDVGSQ